MPSPAVKQLLNFNIDTYLDPFIPPSVVNKLPWPVYRLLGGRKTPQAPVYNVVSWFWIFVGSFAGITLIELVFRNAPALQHIHPPLIIASFGAAAILEYNTIESPLAQPRNFIFGQAIAAAIGISITKLFELLPPARFEDLRWLAGALAVATSSVAMSITKTIHPPAGATALLAATSPDVTELGWDLLPLVLLACALMLASACIINNIQRQFPLYWWTPADLRKLQGKAESEPKPKPDLEDASSKATDSSSGLDVASEFSGKTGFAEQSIDGNNGGAANNEYFSHGPEIRITLNQIFVPEAMTVDAWRRGVLESLQAMLKEAEQSPGS